MNTVNWSKIKEIFGEALKFEVGERRRFLDRVCSTDKELRSEVESLLSSFGKAESFLEEPAIYHAKPNVFVKNEKLIEGQRISHYKILSQIGVGGMGKVYLAHDIRLGRKVAIKILSSNFTADKDRLKRFKREAQTASSLNHPNIITIYEISSEDGQHFIATEYIEGKTLREFINVAYPNLVKILDICIQVARALAAAHQAGIVHRDIKPENIIVRLDGIVKVIDFGLVKLVNNTSEEPIIIDTGLPTKEMESTTPGLILGTVAYMSPEQARGLKIDERSDIWSLGIVLYELITGKVPFAGETVSDCIASILKTKLPPIPETEYTPAELQRIMRKSLAKNCDERYQTARDLLIDLENLRHDSELRVALERSATPHTEKIKTDSNENEPKVITNSDSKKHGFAKTPQQFTSMAEYVTSEIKRHKLSFSLISSALIFSLFFFGSNWYFPKESVSSIAVLPFENAGNDPNTEYLSEGIAESIIKNLSPLQGIKVTARNSSFKYKGNETDLKEAADALGVQVVVTGKIVPLNDHLVVSVELINAKDKTQMWGEQYNRKPADLFQLQSEISKEIAGKLSIRLTGVQEQQAALQEVNPHAYELLLRGNLFWNKGGTENRKKAIEYYNQAIAVDRNYALAYAELSASYSALISYGSDYDPKEYKPKAEEAALKALELDENLPDAHYALAYLKTHSWEWTQAEREYQRTVELNPNYARAHNGYALYLSLMGRHDQAISTIKRARELDPLSLRVNINNGFILYLARRNDQAIETLKKTLELDQNHSAVHLYLGYVYTEKGMYKEAIAAYQEAVRLGDDSSSTQIFLGEAYARSGEVEKAKAILKNLKESKEYKSPAELAVLYAGEC
jgi:serine/threonine protein kinase/Tfp pilus assembly protein PilF